MTKKIVQTLLFSQGARLGIVDTEILRNFSHHAALGKMALLEKELRYQLNHERKRIKEKAYNYTSGQQYLWENVEKIESEIRHLQSLRDEASNVANQLENLTLAGGKLSVRLYLSDVSSWSDKVDNFCNLTEDLLGLYRVTDLVKSKNGRDLTLTGIMPPQNFYTSTSSEVIEWVKAKHSWIYPEFVEFFHEECLKAIDEGKNINERKKAKP